MSQEINCIKLNCFVRLITWVRGSDEGADKKEMLEILEKEYPKEMVKDCLDILISQGFIEEYCFGTALSITDFGWEMTNDFIKTGFKTQFAKYLK